MASDLVQFFIPFSRDDFKADFYRTDFTRLWVNYTVSNLSNRLRIEHTNNVNVCTQMNRAKGRRDEGCVDSLARFSNIINTQSYV